MIYWDTSAIVKLYAQEDDSEKYIEAMLKQAEPIAISPLHQVEVYFALKAKEARGEIRKGESDRLAMLFDEHVSQNRYVLLPWGGDLVAESRRVLDYCLASEEPVAIRSLDGLHIGIAVSVGIEVIITADRRMSDAAKIVGLKCPEL